jgi:hypothetical protein
MERAETKRQEISDREQSSEPNANKIILEKRQVQKDRRQLTTFLADDRRNGIAERRKPG